MNKKNIEEFAVSSRRQLIENLTYEANKIGITKDAIKNPDNIAEDMQTFNTSGVPNTIYGKQIEQRQDLIKEIENNGFDQTIEKIAYTWFNRIIAIRFMEINNYLPTKTRVLSSINPDKKEPDIITEALNINLDYTTEETKKIYQYKEENNTDELFKFLFIKQCNKLNEILPELFEKINDYTELLFNIQLSNENNIINKLINSIPEEDFKNQVEIIGWLYQYYNKELKDEIIDINNSIISKEEIPAATQLFTTDWIVKYMVDNTLGKFYIEHKSTSNIKNDLKFLIKDNLEENNKNINIEEIKFFDPCMGSGHILSYAFDVFMKIYEDLGYYKKEIPQLILENNLFGTDIDDRSYQLTYFSLLLKARKYDRKIFDKQIKLNILSYQETNNLSDSFLINIKKYDDELYKNLQYLIELFNNSKKYGSLIQINDNIDLSALSNQIDEYVINLPNTLSNIKIKEEYSQIIKPLILQAKILKTKYDFVVTNPPYLNKLDKDYKKFANTFYKDYSKDLFSMFIYRNTLFCKEEGYAAFMTPFVWMFIKNYINLRNYIIEHLNISSLIQLEYSAFSEATVPICTFILSKNTKNSNGIFIKLSEFIGGMEIQKNKFLEAINSDVNYKYITNIKTLKNIPNSPISYWVNDNMIKIFKNEKSLMEITELKSGLTTGNDANFLRLWYEVDIHNINFNCNSCEESKNSNCFWYPYNKGGEFKKWYGNHYYVIKWLNNGEQLRKFKKSVIRNPDYYFKKSISWSKVSSGQIAFRYYPSGFIYGGSAASIFPKEDFYYILGLMNSSISQYVLNLIAPTINYELGQIASIPVINKKYEKEITEIVKENIKISKKDWDENEISWNFNKHPLLQNNNTIKENYNIYKKNKEEEFNILKNNETELNKLFSDIYHDSHINVNIPDKYISIKKVDYATEIKSLISYFVGCLFGRYSLDEDGLIYPGGTFNIENYTKFIPDEDNIVPVLDEEYFDDDIVNRFVEFIRIAYNQKDLDDNLKFIANAINKKGKINTESIRKYFINDFIENHVNIYSVPRRKSPIYWMFDSGKENAFKCLIYMHRYEPDLVSRIRHDYLHKTQRAIEENIKQQDNIINNSENKSHVKKANKEKTKLVKQLDEIKLYDIALAHVANQRIEIDLNDGIKANYAKFQNIEVIDPKTNKTKKINLLKKL